jgi:Domain of unknown function (DUF4157)
MPKFHHQRPTRETSPAPQRAKLAEAEPARAIPLRHLAPGAIVQRAMAAPHALRPAELIAMQRTLGNRAAGAMLGRTQIQPKLIVNTPGDKYEREADRVAEQVMRMPASPREAAPRPEHAPEVMTKPASETGGNGSFAAGEDFAQRLQASQGRGRPLPPSLRETFETRFGADFSAVRIHSDAAAGQLSQAIQAQAFTRGSDIFLGAGQSAADTPAGKRLLAHELTHVIQQGAAPLKTAPAPQQAAQPGITARPRGLCGPGSVSAGEPGVAGVKAPQLPQMVQPGAEGMIQREIEKGKLNLVGEAHDESKPRRDDEKAMLREEYGFAPDQYWEENEFLDDKHNYGDPQDLRVLGWAAVMLDSLELNDWDLIFKYFLQFEAEVKRFAQQAPNHRLIPPANDVINVWNDEDRFTPEALQESIRKLLEGYLVWLTPKTSSIFNHVSWQRSMSMLLAVKGSNKTGVWKVGDGHVADILSKHRERDFGDKITFTSQWDFNVVYLLWDLRKNPPTPPTGFEIDFDFDLDDLPEELEQPPTGFEIDFDFDFDLDDLLEVLKLA